MVFFQEIIYLKKDRAYVINLDECKSIGIHWIDVKCDNLTYFDSSGVKHIPKKTKTKKTKEKYIGNKNIITNIYRIQVDNSIMCGHFYTRFIDFILKANIC